MSKIILTISILLVCMRSPSQVIYPFPVQMFKLTIEGKTINMAYMDIKPPTSTATKNVLLLHGKNFNGYYWKELIPFLTAAGYRVIVPNQVGWGQSDRVNLHYSFHMLANNTRLLLESLGINNVIVLGHSMGGMLATRFALMYPALVDNLFWKTR